MVISVVVISKNERSLATTLTGLEKLQTNLGFEVIVVDASGGALSDIRERHPSVVWRDFEAKPGKRITIPEQRNVGVRSSEGEIVVFTDSGCLPRADWLDKLVQPILTGEELVTCGSTGSLRGDHIYGVWEGGSNYVDECATINMAFRRLAFDEVGGFDESFDYCSDTDFTWRLNDAGFRIRWIADARLDHDWGGGVRQLRRAWHYGSGRARLYAKHRTATRWRSLPRRDPILLAYPLFLLGLPLSLKYKAYPLLVLVPFWRNRRSQPIRTLLDHIAYGGGALYQAIRTVT